MDYMGIAKLGPNLGSDPEPLDSDAVASLHQFGILGASITRRTGSEQNCVQTCIWTSTYQKEGYRLLLILGTLYAFAQKRKVVKLLVAVVQDELDKLVSCFGSCRLQATVYPGATFHVMFSTLVKWAILTTQVHKVTAALVENAMEQTAVQAEESGFMVPETCLAPQPVKTSTLPGVGLPSFIQSVQVRVSAVNKSRHIFT